jgi:uncharacterized LabA/DUF88 family protein
MEDTLVFVDDGFFRLLKKHFEKQSGKKKRLLQTFRNICGNENLNLRHLFFYSASPYQSEEPLPKENKLRKDFDIIKKMITKRKWATFREGRCQRLKVDGKFIYNQKGVDILLVIDLMRFQIRFPDVKKIILVACDSDFVPAIKQLRKEGIEVILCTYFDRKRNSPFSRYNELLKSCNKWVKLTEKDFDAPKPKKLKKNGKDN